MPERERIRDSERSSRRANGRPANNNIKVVPNPEDEEVGPSLPSGRFTERSSQLSQMANEIYSEIRRSARDLNQSAAQTIYKIHTRKLMQNYFNKFFIVNEDAWRKQRELERK